jgi:hypothetical protein
MAPGRRVAIVLPPKERFCPGAAGAVSLVVRDLAQATPAGWTAGSTGCPGGAAPPSRAWPPVRSSPTRLT